MFRHFLIALVILQTAALSSAASHTVHQGKVKWWSKTKDIGFITPDNGDPDIYFEIIAVANSSFINKNLSGGLCIRYQIERRLKGPVAIMLQAC